MTDNLQHEHDGPHEGPIKTPKQLIWAVVFSFLIPIIVIVLLTQFVDSAHRPGAGSDLLGAKGTAERIAPVGKVVVKDLSDPASLATGDKVFTAQCASCHATGAAGAPKLADAAAWAPRIKQGFEALLNSALHGKGAMPPQGGGDFTDLEIARAVVYIANQGGAKFEDPKPEAFTAAASAPAQGATQAAAPVAVPNIPPPAAATTTAAAPAGANAAAAPPTLYTQVCQACHSTGVAGAPKVGDKAAWAPRLAAGMDDVMKIVINGKGAMPPRGGSSASDAELKQVVDWMVGQSK